MIFKKIENIKEQFFIQSLSKLKGNILEIGFGKGDNFIRYNPVAKVYGIEISTRKTSRANERCESFSLKNIELSVGSAESLHYESNYFDAVVLSFVFCSVRNPETVIHEINRVLKKTGKLIMFEHIIANNTSMRLLQNIFSKPHAFLFNNCHLNRDPRKIILANNFQIETENIFQLSLSSYLFVEALKK